MILKVLKYVSLGYTLKTLFVQMRLKLIKSLHRYPTHNLPITQSKSLNRLLGYKQRVVVCHDDTCILQDHPLVDQTQRKEKGIYGSDTRADVGERVLFNIEKNKDATQTQKRFLKNARASCILVHTNFISQRDDGDYDLSSRVYGEANNTCSSEKFHNNPVVGFCSGISVKESSDMYKVYSAGHCTKDIQPENIAFIYNFRQQLDGSFPSVIKKGNVCFAKKIYLKEFISGAQDYTVFEMKGPLPFTLSSNDIDIKSEMKKDQKVYVIGYPCGLPQISDVGKILLNDEPTHFTTNLNTFHGNSGSGVFDGETDKLIGLLVRGDTDFVFNDQLKCNVAKICDSEAKDCTGEDCMKMSFILKKEKDLLNGKDMNNDLNLKEQTSHDSTQKSFSFPTQLAKDMIRNIFDRKIHHDCPCNQ